MTTLDAEKLVHRLEELNRTHNGQFRSRVKSMIRLGYVVVHLLWITGLLLLGLTGWALFVVYSMGKLESLVVIKFVISGGIGVGLLAIASRLFFYQPPLPAGFEVTEKDAPQLFAVLEEVRQKINGDHFSRVYLNTQTDSTVVYTPHLMGLLPGESNLVIGLPLLAAMNVEETKALLAHETAHMMRGPGSFAAWVYRNRRMWIGLSDHLKRTGGFLSGPAMLFFRWYIPRVSAYSLVSSREFEYQADQLSVEVAGKEVTARALLLVHALSLHMDEHFRDVMRKSSKTQADVPEGMFQEMLNTIAETRHNGELNRRAEEILNEYSDFFDPHPALIHRLDALGSIDVVDIAGEGKTGLSLLEDTWDAILPMSEIVLREQLAKQWADSHAQHLQDATVLKRIHSADNPPNKWNHEQVLEYAMAARRSLDYETAWDWINHYIEMKPDDSIGFHIRGEMAMERRYDSCLIDFRRVALLSPQMAVEAYRQAIIFAERYQPGSDTTADREALHEVELGRVAQYSENVLKQSPDSLLVETSVHASQKESVESAPENLETVTEQPPDSLLLEPVGPAPGEKPGEGDPKRESSGKHE